MDKLSGTGRDAVVVARIALPVPLFREFDYRVPAGSPVPAPGQRIQAQFAGRILVGICVAVDPPDVWPDARPYLKLMDATPAVGAELMALAQWLSEYYHHPLGEVFAACLPALVRTDRDGPERPPMWQVVPATNVDHVLARSPRQRALYDYLRQLGGATAEALRHAGFTADLLRALRIRGLVDAIEAKVSDHLQTAPARDPGKDLTLSVEQSEAVGAILGASGTFQPFLLQGITGSGKTEVYLRAMHGVVAAGGQALLLVPEIGLTPQTIARVKAWFPAAVALHSGLSDRERWFAWDACRSGRARVLVGTRSSILAQFSDLRLIIVDEEHDSSYKQQDGLRYSARDVAVKRALTLGIPVVLGSATPSLESLHNARLGRYRTLHLRHRAGGAAAPEMHILDLRGVSLQDGMAPELIRRMRLHLESGAQVLTYINRRGFSPALLCATCGWVAECVHCDSRLTLHRTPPALSCHHCGARQPIPDTCPDGHPTLLPVGTGTQRTEEALERIFAGYPVVRIDRDTTRSATQLEAHLLRIATGEPMLLVGTQMLAKGHHFPAVTLVVVINADGGFLSPDFRAPERTAQTIIQVAGRAGRAERAGEVWIQTLQPDNRSLRRLVEDGYDPFARVELDSRIAAGLPPAAAMAIIRADALDKAEAVAFLEAIRLQLGRQVRVSGPAPAPVQRIANRHRQQLLLLADHRAIMQRVCTRLRALEAPRSLRWSIDIDPYDST